MRPRITGAEAERMARDNERIAKRAEQAGDVQTATTATVHAFNLRALAQHIRGEERSR